MSADTAFDIEPLSPEELLPPPMPAAPLDDEALTRELAAENFAALSYEAQNELIAADMRVAMWLLEQGKLDQYRGQNVAILRGQVVGASRNFDELLTHAEQRYHIDPDRVAVMIVDDFWL